MLTPRPNEETDCFPLPSMPVDEIRDQLEILRKLEVNYCSLDYQRLVIFSPVSRLLTIEYLYRIADYGKFQRNTVAYAATNILDRYLSLRTTALWFQDHYQVLALTSLYMAVKVLERQTIAVESLVTLADGDHTEQEFLETERTILKTLDWRIGHGPTPLASVHLYLRLLPEDKKLLTRPLMDHIQFQLELAVSDYQLCIYARPSEIALAAVNNALEDVDEIDFLLDEKIFFERLILNALCRIDVECMTHVFEEKVARIQSRLRRLLSGAFSMEEENNTYSRCEHQKSNQAAPLDNHHEACDDTSDEQDASWECVSGGPGSSPGHVSMDETDGYSEYDKCQEILDESPWLHGLSTFSFQHLFA